MADALPASTLAREMPARSAAGYLVGPFYDGLFFIGSPLLALGLGILLSGSGLAKNSVRVFSDEGTPLTIFIGAFTMAHLFIVIFRSHANRDIFKTHPLRFTLAPVLLFLAMVASVWVQCFIAVLATFWDVYHSSLQTFGLARIYDRKAGNDSRAGRGLDMALNILLYAGPIAAGISLMKHVNEFKAFRAVGSVLLARIPERIAAVQPQIAIAVIVGGGGFILYYLVEYALLARSGHRISPQKVMLLTSTAACSITTWTFDSFGQAFFIMNFFHALQYFALVWHMEKGTMVRTFGLSQARYSRGLAFVLFIAIGAAYGIFAEIFGNVGILLSITLVVSIMHFWWDGFIWSVRRKQIG